MNNVVRSQLAKFGRNKRNTSFYVILTEISIYFVILMIKSQFQVK